MQQAVHIFPGRWDGTAAIRNRNHLGELGRGWSRIQLQHAGDPSAVLDVLEGSCRWQRADGRPKRKPCSLTWKEHLGFAFAARTAPPPIARSRNSANFEGPNRKNAERQKYSFLRCLEMCQNRRVVFPFRLAPPQIPKTWRAGGPIRGSPLPDPSRLLAPAGDPRGMGYLSSVIGHPTDGSSVSGGGLRWWNGSRNCSRRPPHGLCFRLFLFVSWFSLLKLWCGRFDL